MSTDSFLDHVLAKVNLLCANADNHNIKINCLHLHPDDLDRLRDEALARGLWVQKWGIMQYSLLGIQIKASEYALRISNQES